ncbi:MAG: hypothetical protein HYZ10_14670 [Ignavibacteriales bacterium]|nr:hypothetical protein [Ignavibacteriales bacterium]
MFNLASKIFVYGKTLMFYLISLFILRLGTGVSTNYISKLSEQIFVQHLVNMIKPFDSLFFIKSVARYVFIVQTVLLGIITLIFMINLLLNIDEDEIESTSGKSKNIIIEVGLITISVLNICFIALFVLGLNVIFNPTKVVTLAILLFIVIATASITYSILNEKDEPYLSQNKLISSIVNMFKNFNYPYFPLALLLYIALQLEFKILVQHSSTGWIVVQPIIKLLSFIISISSMLYFLFGLAKYVNHRDEFIRKIIYEQLFITFLAIWGMQLLNTSVAIAFNYTKTLEDTGGFIIPVMIISSIFRIAKYQ